MKQRGSITFLKITVFIIGLVTLILCLFFLPSLANNTANMYPEFAYLQYPILFGLYVTLVPFFFALYQALNLLKYINGNHAFSEVSITALNRIKYCAVAIILLYVIGIIYIGIQGALHPSIAIVGFVILFATFIILIFAAVLQELLESALRIKSENDLTV
ncbi:DUF2975 domain-containing protein [Virgibacillus sp. W0181]|uniref:DUF2975 domain-containing protein n=1 Tax=Virgibacillus sp. W0181 TaxID=3391581 RepID=UPI003F48B12D